MTDLNQIATKIIKEQELIIGPVAWSEARKVAGLEVIDEKRGLVKITNGDGKAVIDRLVAQYERLFGRASHEVCREAASTLLVGWTPTEVPASLR